MHNNSDTPSGSVGVIPKCINKQPCVKKMAKQTVEGMPLIKWSSDHEAGKFAYTGDHVHYRMNCCICVNYSDHKGACDACITTSGKEMIKMAWTPYA